MAEPFQQMGEAIQELQRSVPDPDELDLVKCDHCGERIPLDRMPHVMPEPWCPGVTVSVCDRCAPGLVIRVLSRYPARDRAESTARDVLRQLLSLRQAGEKRAS